MKKPRKIENSKDKVCGKEGELCAGTLALMMGACIGDRDPLGLNGDAEGLLVAAAGGLLVSEALGPSGGVVVAVEEPRIRHRDAMGRWVLPAVVDTEVCGNVDVQIPRDLLYCRASERVVGIWASGPDGYGVVGWILSSKHLQKANEDPSLCPLIGVTDPLLGWRPECVLPGLVAERLWALRDVEVRATEGHLRGPELMEFLRDGTPEAMNYETGKIVLVPKDLDDADVISYCMNQMGGAKGEPEPGLPGSWNRPRSGNSGGDIYGVIHPRGWRSAHVAYFEKKYNDNPGTMEMRWVAAANGPALGTALCMDLGGMFHVDAPLAVVRGPTGAVYVIPIPHVPGFPPGYFMRNESRKSHKALVPMPIVSGVRMYHLETKAFHRLCVTVASRVLVHTEDLEMLDAAIEAIRPVAHAWLERKASWASMQKPKIRQISPDVFKKITDMTPPVASGLKRLGLGTRLMTGSLVTAKPDGSLVVEPIQVHEDSHPEAFRAIFGQPPTPVAEGIAHPLKAAPKPLHTPVPPDDEDPSEDDYN